MKVNFLSIALKLCVIVMFCGFGMNLYAVNVKTAEAAGYIDLGDGEKFSSMKIPVIRNRLRSEARNSSVSILKINGNLLFAGYNLKVEEWSQ